MVQEVSPTPISGVCLSKLRLPVVGPGVSDSHQNHGHDGQVRTVALGLFPVGGRGPRRLLQAMPATPQPGSRRQSRCAPALAAAPLRGPLQEAAGTSDPEPSSPVRAALPGGQPRKVAEQRPRGTGSQGLQPGRVLFLILTFPLNSLF